MLLKAVCFLVFPLDVALARKEVVFTSFSRLFEQCFKNCKIMSEGF